MPEKGKTNNVNGFPRRIYTLDEFQKARKSVDEGHKHTLTVKGSESFKKKLETILSLIRKADCYNFLRTYIRSVSEVEGISQLREAEATIWINDYVINNPIEGARFIIQKAYQMRAYLKGEQYYIKGEKPAIDASIAFLKKLLDRLRSDYMKDLCEESIRQWTEEFVL